MFLLVIAIDPCVGNSQDSLSGGGANERAGCIVAVSHLTAYGEDVLSESPVRKFRLGEQQSVDLGEIVLIEDAIPSQKGLLDGCLRTKVIVNGNVAGERGLDSLEVRLVETS